MINIFLSRPTWIAPSFRDGVERFEEHLRGLDLAPRTIGTTDYPTTSPLDAVVELMSKCHGAVILGVPQLVVQQGTLKDRAIAADLHLATEWNHIEAGIAYALGLPVIVIHHNSVARGIFDRGRLNAFLYSKDLSNPTWWAEREIQGSMRTWRGTLRPAKRLLGPQSGEQVKPAVPRCPSCEASLMNPVPVDFRKILAADWECPSCEYRMKE